MPRDIFIISIDGISKEIKPSSLILTVDIKNRAIQGLQEVLGSNCAKQSVDRVSDFDDLFYRSSTSSCRKLLLEVLATLPEIQDQVR